MAEEPTITFICVKEKNKLRVRIITNGYHHDANCQFPRGIRKENMKYSAPISAVKFAQGPAGKYFYRVNKNYVKMLNENEEIVNDKLMVKKIFEDEDTQCAICLDNEREIVMVPCGHYCICGECANQIIKSFGTCPLCRTKIELAVTRDQIQI